MNPAEKTEIGGIANIMGQQKPPNSGCGALGEVISHLLPHLQLCCSCFMVLNTLWGRGRPRPGMGMKGEMRKGY